jgi:hypothetical protein
MLNGIPLAAAIAKVVNVTFVNVILAPPADNGEMLRAFRRPFVFE